MMTTPHPHELPKKLRWAHSVDSIESLHMHLSDSEITAFEVDVILGTLLTNNHHNEIGDKTTATAMCCSKKKNDDYSEPSVATIHSTNDLQLVLTHPPSVASDLSLEYFLDQTLYEEKKHIKLDFKHIDVVQPTLDILGSKIIADKTSIILTKNNSYSACHIHKNSANLSSSDLNNNSTTNWKQHQLKKKKWIYLNADIVLGPGYRRDVSARVASEPFLEQCKTFIDRMMTTNCSYDAEHCFTFALSLAWTIGPRAFEGYSREDVQQMINLIERHRLQTYPIVFAVNARLLSRSFDTVELLLKQLPQAQLCIWTATGEPAISYNRVNAIKYYFTRRGYDEDRLGFDCKVTENVVHGFWCDSLMLLVGLVWSGYKEMKYLSSWLVSVIRAFAANNRVNDAKNNKDTTTSYTKLPSPPIV